MALNEEQIKNAVRERYGKLAVLNESCCGDESATCCSTSITETGLPEEAAQVVASCGTP